MSYRFPIVRPETKEIIEPDDLNQNFKQFIDEINGNLSRENLTSVSATSGGLLPQQFKNNSFNEVYQSSIESSADWDSSGSNAFNCSKNTTGYVSIDSSDRSMPSVEFTAERDGWVIVDFSVAHLWLGTGLLSEDEAKRVLHVRPHRPFTYGERLWGHNSTLPPGAWLGITGEADGKSADDPTTPQLNHEGHLERMRGGTTDFKDRNFPQGKYLNWPIDRYAVRYRITSNGSEVAESGWQYNGNDRSGVYICGCIPVRAGRNTIKTEVSAAMIENIYGVSQGIRSYDDKSKKGKFFPKSIVSSRNNLHTLPKSKTLNISYQNINYKIKSGINVVVHSGNLVVQYRKA